MFEKIIDALYGLLKLIRTFIKNPDFLDELERFIERLEDRIKDIEDRVKEIEDHVR